MISLEIVRTWHGVFHTYVLSMLDSGTVAEPTLVEVSDHHSCEFGKWLEGLEGEFGRLPCYRTLCIAHRLFHQGIKDAMSMQALNPGNGADTKRAARKSVESLSVLVSFALREFEPHYLAGRAPARREANTYVRDMLLRSNFVLLTTTELREIVDVQHQQIVSLFGKLLKLSDSTTTSEATMDQIFRLSRIFEQHFETEEVLMERDGIPLDELQAHQAGHLSILEGVASILSDVIDAHHMTARTVLQRVLDLFMIDIQTLDTHLLTHVAAAPTGRQAGATTAR